MPEKTNFNEKSAFKCSICGFLYKEEKTAEECEKWCREHKSCNIEITKKAIKIRQDR